MISTKQRLAAANSPNATMISPFGNSTGNPRKLTISGTYDPVVCPLLTIQVTYFDVDGGVISTDGPVTPGTIDGQFWDHTVDAPTNAVSCTIVVFCGGVAQETISDVGFEPAPTAASRGPVFTAVKSGVRDLTMTVNNPAAADPADCDTITVLHHVSHTETYAFLPHYHSSSPGPGLRTVTYQNLTPGRYSTRLVYLPAKGQPVSYSPPIVKIA
jgi:hypothetical protein